MIRRALIPGLLLGLALRLLALPTHGTGDVGIWKVWAFGASHDISGVYGVGGSPPERRVLHWQGDGMTVDYPPLALMEVGLAGRLYAMTHPRFEDSRALNVFVKLPGLAFEALAVGLLLTMGRRRLGADASAALALAFWLNPGVILDGAVLGYLDAQMAVPAAIAVVIAFLGPAWLAGAVFMTAALTKAQAVFVGPVLLAVLLRNRQKVQAAWQAAAGAAGVAICVLLPYAARGALPNLAQAIGRLGTHDMLSANGANVWWIFTWVLRVLDVAGEWGWQGALTQEVRILAISRAIALGYPNARVIGLVLVATACAWGAWRAWRAASLAEAAAWAGWCAWGYFVLSAQVHENHMYLAIPLLVLAAGLDRRYRLIAAGATAVLTLNLLLFYGLGRGVPFVDARGWTLIDASVLLAMANVALFVLAAVVIRRSRSAVWFHKPRSSAV